MDRDELLQVATQLMAALIVEDRIAWFKDPECFGMAYDDIADHAVRSAKELIERVDRECPPVKPQPPSTPMDGNPLSHVIYTD